MEQINKEQLKQMKETSSGAVFYASPFCRTCQIAERVIEPMRKLYDVPFYKVNINEIPQEAVTEKIQSVPCLIVFKNGEPVKKMYTFDNPPYVLEQLHGEFQSTLK
ncbi:thioredoxin family protein [Sinobaca sp. H24]|uniref:thioredoxin family protein n=1 Tax=Sinobaca sp. H24 TaxID=2923376 RepID=UPI0020797845|nr:thioredoxin family protein [Sinobaca sp. H24]